MISFRCQGCGQKYKVKDEWAGKRSRCKQCNHIMNIPALDEDVDIFTNSDSVVMATIVDDSISDNQSEENTYKSSQNDYGRHDTISRPYLKIVIPIAITTILVVSAVLWLAFRDTWERITIQYLLSWPKKLKILLKMESMKMEF